MARTPPTDAITTSSPSGGATRDRSLVAADSEESVNDGDGAETRVLSLAFFLSNDGPPRPTHLLEKSLGVPGVSQTTGVMQILNTQGAPPGPQMQYAVCQSFGISDDFFDLLSGLWTSTLPRNLTVDRVDDEEVRVVWHAVGDDERLYPIDISNWLLPGGVRVCRTSTIRASRTTRKRAFEELVEQIEECSSDLPSLKYLKLYDSARALHEVVDGSPLDAP